MRSASRPSKRCAVSESRRVRATPMRCGNERRDLRRRHAERRLGDRELRIRRRQHDVAAAHQAEPAAIGRALDHHHDRLRQRLEARHDRAEARDCAARRRRCSPAFGSGVENISLKPLMSPPAQNVPFAPRTTAARISRRCASRYATRGQIAHHRAAERILRLRPVERDVQHAALERSSSSVSKLGRSLISGSSAGPAGCPCPCR